MKNLHTIETIQEKGTVLFTIGEAQEKLSVIEYNGSLLYDGPEFGDVVSDTPEARREMFLGIVANLQECDVDFSEEIAELKAMAE